ncbi:trigger factor [Ancrocorticia populi]|uniref:Trigger factor n=1 Tax=Ancrocorticia populi TaxID=2175228 RepID=A0A2V1K9R3_9ACTO|nr:trigger factor [Ancrocorticia populi]PWF25692.1 trigger factor [Ancrocorticia populi]
MKSSVEILEPTKVKVTIEVPFEEFKPAIERSAKEIGKQVNIPGFRKGHVPTRVLEAQFGRGAIVEDAVNNSLDGYYSEAVRENELVPMSQPEVDVTAVPVDRGDESDLVFAVTVDVRPEIVIPDPAGITLTVDSVAVTDEDTEERLTSLRERFGTLKDVERAAADGDFVTIDMTAEVDGEEIDSVSGVSYQIGSGTMLDGIDEALVGLSAGETTSFTSKIAGGEHEGEDGDVTVTVEAVQEQELPEADDDFAQLASEFDTIDELKDDLHEQVAKDKQTNQVYAARDQLLETLRDGADFPIPASVVEQEVANHLEQEGKESDDPHAEEIRGDIESALRDQMMLDKLSEMFKTQPDQNELFSFMMEQAQNYGMDPNQFIQAAAQTNQIGAFAGELTRGKALISALRLAKVVDSDGNELNVTDVVGEAAEGEEVPDFAAQPAKAAAPTAQTTEAEEPAAESTELFDPSTAKVDEVLAYASSVDDAERARILEAEKAGKARKSVIAKLS